MRTAKMKLAKSPRKKKLKNEVKSIVFCDGCGMSLNKAYKRTLTSYIEAYFDGLFYSRIGNDTWMIFCSRECKEKA